MIVFKRNVKCVHIPRVHRQWNKWNRAESRVNPLHLMELWQIWFCAENRRILRHILKQFQSVKNLHLDKGTYCEEPHHKLVHDFQCQNTLKTTLVWQYRKRIPSPLPSAPQHFEFLSHFPQRGWCPCRVRAVAWCPARRSRWTGSPPPGRRRRTPWQKSSLTFFYKSFFSFLLSNYLGCQGCFRVFCQVPEIFSQEPILAVTEILFLQTFLIFLLAQILRFNFLVDFRFIRWEMVFKNMSTTGHHEIIVICLSIYFKILYSPWEYF